MLYKKYVACSVLALSAAACFASPVTPGDLVIYRVGDGSGPLVNTGSAVFVDEYTQAGTLVQSIAMPSSGTLPTGQNYLVASGTATSEGLLTVSPNGQYITLTGYDRATGGSGSLTSSSSTTVPRTIGIIPISTGAPDTSTALTDFTTANNPRTAVTTDGTNLWIGGAADVSFTTKGSTTSTLLTTAIKNNNVEQLNIFDGQLYFSSQKTTGAIGSIGNGLPVTGSQSTTMLPGGPSTTNGYAFVMFDMSSSTPGLDTLYVADDTTSGGIIAKYDLIGSSWTAEGSITAPGVRGLTGDVDASGNADLFGTTGGSGATGGGTLYSFTDSSGFGSTASGITTNVLTLPANSDEAFRGIAIVPVPEPATIGLLGLSVLCFAKRSRR